MSLRHQQGLPKPLLPAGKAGAVGHCTGQAIPVREDGGADAPCLQQQPLLPAHGQRVVFPAGEAALVGILPPEQAVACLVGQPSEALSAQDLTPAHRGQALPGADDHAARLVKVPGGGLRADRHRRRRRPVLRLFLHQFQGQAGGGPGQHGGKSLPVVHQVDPAPGPKGGFRPQRRSASLTAVSRGRR